MSAFNLDSVSGSIADNLAFNADNLSALNAGNQALQAPQAAQPCFDTIRPPFECWKDW